MACTGTGPATGPSLTVVKQPWRETRSADHVQAGTPAQAPESEKQVESNGLGVVAMPVRSMADVYKSLESVFDRDQ
jgi:hypothetical protein